MMRMLLGLLVVMVGMVPSLTSAQDATPTACGRSQILDGRLVPQQTAIGLAFAGDAGGYLSQPFTLPAGTVLFMSDLEPGGMGTLRVAVAPPQ